MGPISPLHDGDLLSHLVDTLPSGITLFEAVRDDRGRLVDLRLRYMNGTARAGQPDPTRALGRHASALWPQMVASGLLERALRVLETGGDDHGEVTWTEASYRPAGYEWDARRLGPDLLAWVFRDATVRLRQARELEEHAQRMEATVERQSQLLRLTAGLGRALTIEQIFAALQEIALPLVALPAMTLVVPADDTQLRFTRITSAEVGPTATMAVTEHHPFTDVWRSGRALYTDRDAALERWPGIAEEIALSPAKGWAMLPLLASQGTVGVVVLGFDRQPPSGRGDRALMETLAALTAQAVERAQLYQAESERATALQRALLPVALPEVAGVRLARRYVPAEHGSLVGGDWYDVLTLPSGGIGLVMGDAEGHSVQAAALMGQIRNVLRAYAHEGHGPAALMSRVNRFLCDQAPLGLASCCYAELNPLDGALTYVLAGHPPPVLVSGSGCTLLEETGGLLLGIDPDHDYDEQTVVLPPGCTLGLYTDGLVESRHTGLSQGLTRLLALAEEAGTTDPEALAEQFLGQGRPGGGTGDDAAVLLARFSGSDRTEAVFSRVLPSDPSSPAAARHFVVDVLRQWQLADLTDTAALVVTELTTNAMLHTLHTVGIRVLRRGDGIRLEISDESVRLPVLRDPDPDSISGRGMVLVDALAEQWGTVQHEDGKTVWADLHLPAHAAA